MTDQITEKPPLRDENGTLRADFVAEAARAIEAVDVPKLRVLVGDLHEYDLGALLEALDPDQRPRLVELLGIDFDFTALTEVDDTVREEILDELEPQTVAEGEKFNIECVRSQSGPAGKITITNYERLDRFDANDFVGVVCDESSILKSFDGSRRQAITDFMRKMPYRLLATATAAPRTRRRGSR